MKTLFYGGNILTMAQPLRAGALLVEDGRILAVGELDALRSLAGDCRLVDLAGRTLLPGFIDAHSHFSQVAGGLLQVSLDGAADADGMRRRVEDYIRRTGTQPGAWVTARDYDNNLLPGARHLTLAQVDALAPENPLVIQHKSGHMGLFNTLALRALGVTPDTPAPQGGRIGRDGGALTGYMEENAFFEYLKKVPRPAPEAMLDAYRRAQRLYASYGITTIQEGMVVEEMLPLYEALLQRGLLELDLAIYPDVATFPSARRLFGEQAAQGGRLRLCGIKIFLDGSPQGRTAWMRAPYAGEASYCGYGTLRDEDVLAALETAARAGVQLLAHCNGDAAAAQYLRCLRQAEAAFPALARLRPVMIHAQFLGLDQIPEAAALGVVASFFVAHVYHWGDTHIRNMGPARASRLSPAASALKAGLPFTFHQDAPVIRPDMLETVWCAVERLTRDGVCLGPEERISPLEALRAVTATAAWQYGEENAKGTLAPGKRADLAVLDRDPLTADPMSLRDIRVLQTYKDGRLIYERTEHDDT